MRMCVRNTGLKFARSPNGKTSQLRLAEKGIKKASMTVEATVEASSQHGFIGTPRKVTGHLTQNEPLSFEKSSPGKKGYKLAPLDVPEIDAEALLGAAAREDEPALPELSEIEIIRHFTRLSTWNYAIDLGMYPLGSCTMKYNPRVNEFVARLE